MSLYLNHSNHFQEKIDIVFDSDSGTEFSEHAYEVTPEPLADYIYSISLNDDTNWEEASINGVNLCLTDDTVTEIELPFVLFIFWKRHAPKFILFAIAPFIRGGF